MRIRIPPNEVASLSSRLKAASVELSNSRQTIIRAAARLDWEVSRRPEIDSLIRNASTTADRLTDEVFRLSNYLKRVASRFQETDSRFQFQLNESAGSFLYPFKRSEIDNSAVSSVSLINSYAENNRALDIMNTATSPHANSLRWIKRVIS